MSGYYGGMSETTPAFVRTVVMTRIMRWVPGVTVHSDATTTRVTVGSDGLDRARAVLAAFEYTWTESTSEGSTSLVVPADQMAA